MVLVLVDSGVSHNFISRALVEEMKLEVDDARSHLVCLGDGQRKKTQGSCKGVVLQLGGAEII